MCRGLNACISGQHILYSGWANPAPEKYEEKNRPSLAISLIELTLLASETVLGISPPPLEKGGVKDPHPRGSATPASRGL